MEYCTIEEAWGPVNPTQTPLQKEKKEEVSGIVVKPIEIDATNIYSSTKPIEDTSVAKPSVECRSLENQIIELNQRIQEIGLKLETMVKKIHSNKSSSYTDLLIFMIIGILFIFILDFIFRWSRRFPQN